MQLGEGPDRVQRYADLLAWGDRAANLNGPGHIFGSINGDQRAVIIQYHLGPHLDPRDEGISLFLPLEVVFLNSIGSGRHQRRSTSRKDLLYTRSKERRDAG